jgi:hypothetical protein
MALEKTEKTKEKKEFRGRYNPAAKKLNQTS